MSPGHPLLRPSAFLLLFTLFAVPSRADAPRVDLFAKTTAPTTAALRPVATRGASFARLDAAAVSRLRSAASARITLPTAEGDLTLALVRDEMLLSRATVTSTDDAGPHAFDPGTVCLRGSVEGDPASTAVVTLGPGGAMGFVGTRGRRWAIAPVAGGLERIADEDQLPALSPLTCGTPDPPPSDRDLRAGARTTASPGRYVCNLAIDCDYEWYTKFGSDLSLATQYVQTVLAVVSLIYERDVGTAIRIGYLNVWTTASDPYTSTLSSGAKDQFLIYWEINRKNVARTIALLVSGKTFTDRAGYSDIDVLCASPTSGSGFAVAACNGVNNLPNNVTTRDVELIAHEMGHEFGSWHTQSCNWASLGYAPPGALLDSCYTQEGSCYTGPVGILPPDKGTIMSYCEAVGEGGVTNIRLAFHPACAAHMRARVEASCMPQAVFPPPGALAASAAGTSTRLTWQPSGISDVFRYDVYRSTSQFDPAPQLIGSTSDLTFDDPAPPWVDFHYRVRGMTPSGPTEWSNEIRFDRCPWQETGRYPAGTHPLSMVPADFDGDGHLDLAVVNGGVGFSVLKGDGAGHLGAPSSYSNGTNPISLAFADFNGDGIADFALDYFTDNKIQLYLGQANGTFVPSTSLATLAGPQGLVAGDFDENGITDLAVAQVSAGMVSTWLGQGSNGIGDGTFAPPVSIAVPNARELALTELNGDGIADLVVLPSNGPRVLLGNGTGGKGDGTFTAAGSYGATTPTIGLATGDLNGDGLVDLAIGSLREETQVCTFTTWFGVGDGTFTSRHDYPTTPWAIGLGIDDWTQDGLADVGIGADYPTRGGLIHPGVGGGLLGGGTHLDSGDDARTLASGDFDEDGLPDVALSNVNLNTISIFRHTCPREIANAAHLVAPDGGESMEIGSEQTITWTRDPGCVAVALEISRDGGVKWATLAKNVVGSSYRWTVTGPPTNTARIRVVNASVPSAGDASAADFAITGSLVATQLSLAGRDVAPRRVALTWQGRSAATLGATVERRDASSPWRVLGPAERVADDLVRFVDTSVAPGERWAYRLTWSEGGEAATTAEEWIDVPAAVGFALDGLRPNPAAGVLRVGFSLPEAAAASLDLLDLAGRRLATRDVGTLGAGRHLVTLETAGALRAGVYWLRLTQGAREERKRAVVMR